MDCISTRLPYRQTGSFSKIALDYIDQSIALKPFYTHPPTLAGIQKAIEDRKKFTTDRNLLVKVLHEQYNSIETMDRVKKNIDLLLKENTFTVTTAHQNNIFSGPLYFIYKIIHAIKLAGYLEESLPQYNFIPVFYIGTEDADLEELNHIWLGGEKLVWDTKQKGAVGRMMVDKGLLKLLDRIEGQLAVEPFGNEIVALLRESYKTGDDIQTATFKFVNSLFAEYGLLVLLPDNTALKKQMISLFEDDLLNQTASGIVEKTTEGLQSAGYKTQANPREINLFYLKDDIRDRFVLTNSPQDTAQRLTTHDSRISFSSADLIKELREYPERFSPNVILRGLYQETILPNIAFIGGAGEMAYWLQLKDLFTHYKIPFPVLVLRNSFLVMEKKWREKISQLGFTPEDFFLPEEELMNKLVTRETKNDTKLNGSLTELEKIYEAFKKQAAAVDGTLEKHVDALKLKTVQRLQDLEKKMLRAEKRKFTDQQRQIHAIREYLFPGNGLQERRENICYYYAKWGSSFLEQLFKNSLALEQEFVVLSLS